MIEYLNLETIITIGTSIVTIASFITASTDTPKDDGFVRNLYKIIEFLALVNEKAKQK